MAKISTYTGKPVNPKKSAAAKKAAAKRRGKPLAPATKAKLSKALKKAHKRADFGKITKKNQAAHRAAAAKK